MDPTLLLVLAVVVVLVYFFFIAAPEGRPKSNLVQRPSDELGRLEGKGLVEQFIERKTAQNEALINAAETQSVREIHDRRMTDLADKHDLPRALWERALSSEHEQKMLFERMEKQAQLEVDVEAAKINVWLTAARNAQLAPYANVEGIEKHIEAAYDRRHRLRELPARTGAQDDMLALLEKAIPVLEAGYHGQLRQIALQAGDGEEL